MIIMSQEAVRSMYKDKRLKKLTLKFAKLFKKRFSHLQLYLDFESEMNLPILVAGIPDNLEIQNMEKFSGEIGKLIEESGNLAEISDLFVFAVEKISTIEKRRI